MLYFFLLENLGLAQPDFYTYLSQSGTYTVEGINDAQEFQDTNVSSCMFYKNCIHNKYI